MAQPDFLIIGAPKSGTTSLYHYLQQHPGVYMSPLKEPHFFLFDGPDPPPMKGPEDAVQRREMIRSWGEYQRLFDARAGGQVCGEASIRYLYSAQACAAIRRRLPEVKLVALLRNPADRAYSAYRRDRRHGTEPLEDFADAIDDAARRAAAG